jgi:hypothetical protein
MGSMSAAPCDPLIWHAAMPTGIRMQTDRHVSELLWEGEGRYARAHLQECCRILAARKHDGRVRMNEVHEPLQAADTNFVSI